MMHDPLFPPPSPPFLPIEGDARCFPVHRIYCVGRNYADHVREMGGDASRDPPIFFTKPADAIVGDGMVLPFPCATNDLHHEVELVVALGHGGHDLTPAQAADCVAGYAVGIDLTRRDLQNAAKQRGQPWDVAKAFDRSAPIGHLRLREDWQPQDQHLRLWVDDQLRQDGQLQQMILDVPTLLAELSKLFELAPGDLVFTGTPAGVGPVRPGQRVRASIDGLPALNIAFAP
ncbi:MAG: fumarylacetoacetate hydrolase family protein [Xanthomonadales bacterium]|nr:fumarylacetoacetate hydrolase family protein [Xanthomonadales bacterium]